MDDTTNPIPTRTEADRLLSIATKLLNSRDLTGSREFALLAQETDPLLEGSDQIIAIADVILASENPDRTYYSILQTEPRSEPGLIRQNYRRLALLLHPDKNSFPLSGAAFKLVADAWATLSDPNKRDRYDHELEGLDLRHGHLDSYKLPVRRSMNNDNSSYSNNSFWTMCPYCYVLFEYAGVYKECCMRCQNCDKFFHAAVVPSLPPLVPGKEAYYCCWGFFPLGFSGEGNGEGEGKGKGKGKSVHRDNPSDTGFVKRGATKMGNVNVDVNVNVNAGGGGRGVVDFSEGGGSERYYENGMPRMSVPGAKKRGRPRKNPLGL